VRLLGVTSLRRALRYGFLLGCDALVCTAALYVALLLRFQGDIPTLRVAGFMDAWPVFVAVSLAIFVACGLYDRVWRYFSFVDLTFVVKLVSASTVAAVVVLFLTDMLAWMPRSVAVIYGLLAVFGLGGIRAARRSVRQRLRRNNHTPTGPVRAESVKRTLIVGDIDWAESVIEQLVNSHDRSFAPIGLLDHSGLDVRLRVHGVPVLGTLDALRGVVEKLTKQNRRPQTIIVNSADPQLKGRAMVGLVSEAETLGLEVAKVADRHLQKARPEPGLVLEYLNVTDLLGRNELELDSSVVARSVEGRRVMVTGAGGTIGSELVRQLARFGPAEIQLLDCGEFNLYSIDMELGENFPEIPRQPILCSIRQRESIMAAFKEHRPELIFHAAALKHVPLVEENPCSGAQTNVIGTRNIADAARTYGALAMVQVSSDKAVNPVGFMGATKRLGELYCQALDLVGYGDADAPRFMTVRFGNVLGSSGSLIPLFARQLSRGGPLTVTDPAIERYFMTVHEAVQLILHSSAQALQTRRDHGKVFVLDMGEPVNILELARRMIRLAGLTPDVDIKIEITGLRPGEKLFEELFDKSEKHLHSNCPGIFRAMPVSVPLPILNERFDEIERAARRSNADKVRQLVQDLVNYRPKQDKLVVAPATLTIPSAKSAPRKVPRFADLGAARGAA
jgi:FlaA1/EpsC-like NDP-sugar epimerase